MRPGKVDKGRDNQGANERRARKRCLETLKFGKERKKWKKVNKRGKQGEERWGKQEIEDLLKGKRRKTVRPSKGSAEGGSP